MRNIERGRYRKIERNVQKYREDDTKKEGAPEKKRKEIEKNR